MPTPKPRFDGYGYPIRPLVDARSELFYERPANVHQRQFIAQVLEKYYRELLCRGKFAEIVVHLKIKDGMLTTDLSVGLEEIFRSEQE